MECVGSHISGQLPEHPDRNKYQVQGSVVALGKGEEKSRCELPTEHTRREGTHGDGSGTGTAADGSTRCRTCTALGICR